MLDNFNGQAPIIIRELMSSGKTRAEAVTFWETSKTKKRLEDNNLYYVSAMRIVWELMCEERNDPRWFNEPFDM